MRRGMWGLGGDGADQGGAVPPLRKMGAGPQGAARRVLGGGMPGLRDRDGDGTGPRPMRGRQCNQGLGMFDDNPGVLLKAREYIDSYIGVVAGNNGARVATQIPL